MKYIITESQSKNFLKKIELFLTKTYKDKDICGIEVIFEPNDDKKINVDIFVSEDWKPRQNEELYKIRKNIKNDLKNYFIGGNFSFSVMMHFENCDFYNKRKERLSN